MNSRKSIVFNVLFFGAIILGYVVVTLLSASPEAKTLSFENSSLQVDLKPLSGVSDNKPVNLKEFRSKNILIHFWASGCGACEADQRLLNELARSGLGSSIQIIGITSSDSHEAIEKSGKLKNLAYPQYLEESGGLALALGVKTVPQTLLIDAGGRVLIHLKEAISQGHQSDLKNKMAALAADLYQEMGAVPDFTLSSSLGELVSRSTLKEKIWVVDFIFTSCRSMCPMLTSKMRMLQEQFGGDDRFRLVSITVDPETDTQDALRTYQKKNGIDPKKWHFLTGKLEAIKNLLVGGFRLGTFDNPEFHSGKFVLIDQLGKIRGYYDAESRESVDRLKSDITRILKFGS